MVRLPERIGVCGRSKRQRLPTQGNCFEENKLSLNGSPPTLLYIDLLAATFLTIS